MKLIKRKQLPQLVKDTKKELSLLKLRYDTENLTLVKESINTLEYYIDMLVLATIKRPYKKKGRDL